MREKEFVSFPGSQFIAPEGGRSARQASTSATIPSFGTDWKERVKLLINGLDFSDIARCNLALQQLSTLAGEGDAAVLYILSQSEFTEKRLSPFARKAVLETLGRFFEENPPTSERGREFLSQTFENHDFPSGQIVGIAVGHRPEGRKYLEDALTHEKRSVRGRAKFCLNRLQGINKKPVVAPVFGVPFIRGYKNVPNLRKLYYDEPIVENPIPIAQTEGMPPASRLIVERSLVQGHPLRKYCLQDCPATTAQLQEILEHPMLKGLKVVEWVSGALPAAFGLDPAKHSVGELMAKIEGMHHKSYGMNSWFRDNGIVISAFMSAGLTEYAIPSIRAATNFLATEEIRNIMARHHYESKGDAKLYNEGLRIPVKARIDPKTGRLVPITHGWHHGQLDAVGIMNAHAYEMLNLAWRGNTNGSNYGFDTFGFDPEYTDGTHKEHVMRALIKTLYHFDAPNTMNTGPWEDDEAWARASCNGAVWWAARSALAFHREHGFHALGVAGDNFGAERDFANRTFEQQLVHLHSTTREKVALRIPDAPNAFAIESDDRPYDSAVVLNRSHYRLPLTPNQDNAILRTFFRNLGPVAARRWECDSKQERVHGRGDDNYMGLNYHVHYTDSRERGAFFADMNQETSLSPEWPCIQAWGGIAIAQRILREIDIAPDVAEENYIYLWRILQRSLACILKEDSVITLSQTGENIPRPAGTVSEVMFQSDYTPDGKRKTARHYEAGHYCGLAMAHAPIAQLAIMTYKIRTMLDEVKRR